jgi:hypothetical protein
MGKTEQKPNKIFFLGINERKSVKTEQTKLLNEVFKPKNFYFILIK